jgi:glycosyltransferase involved in cell wall biosynthesis
MDLAMFERNRIARGGVITDPSKDIELSIVMPCLDEAETLGVCIASARNFLQSSGIQGEIVVADNGSTDGSQSIALAQGVRVVDVATRGYGAAVRGGIVAANGRFVIIGDADDSYDFTNLMPFMEKLRAGADLVVGNRFRAGIEAGAMPFLHRYLGNPVLSFLGRLLYRARVGDFHCGLRGCRRQQILALGLRAKGMEFASELIVRSALAAHTIVEVPTFLRRDGRSRPPHLRTWRDGLRHLGLLLRYSPLLACSGLALLILALGALMFAGWRYWAGFAAYGG